MSVDPRSPNSAAEPQHPTAREIWVKPVIEKMAAADAEVGTRASNDGAFTTS